MGNHEYRSEQRKKNRVIINTLKKNLKCKECGISGETCPTVIEFHHKDPNNKTATISELIHNGVSMNRILKELKLCDALCANCHRRKHYKEEG